MIKELIRNDISIVVFSTKMVNIAIDSPHSEETEIYFLSQVNYSYYFVITIKFASKDN